MGINLEKGQRTGLSQQKFNIGLSWDANETDSGGQFDLDASVFGLGDTGKIVSEDYFVFYNHLQTSDKSITHTGDNQSGAGDGDDETIEVDLSKIDSKIRIYVPGTNEELLNYELDEDYSTETALEFGRIYNKYDNWKFEAVGSGMAGGLDAFLKKFS